MNQTRHYYLNNQQAVEERLNTGTAADRQNVWGLAYVDQLVLRDRDTDANGSLDERLYGLQDANFNLTSVMNTSGSALERYTYTPYGARSIFDASWGTRSSSSYSWDVGHQGLFHDSETGLIYNRARFLHPNLGRFMQRDPLGYVDGMNVYQYLNSNPQGLLDSEGTDSGFWEYTKCFDKCLQNNDPVSGAINVLLRAGQLERFLSYINPDWFIGANKKKMADFALKLGERETAEVILRNMIQEGKAEKGSLRILIKRLTERGENVGKILGRELGVLNGASAALGAVMGVLELGRFTHCAGTCGSLRCSGMRYEDAKDKFIEDYLRYYGVLQ